MKKRIYEALSAIRFRYFVWLMACVLICSCGSKEPVVPSPVDTDLEFQFRLLNDKKQESTTFRQGENFWLSFIIINKSANYWRLMPEGLSRINDFLRVYDKQNKDMGRPYKFIFECMYIPSFPVTTNDTMKIELPWQQISGYDNRFFCGLDTTKSLPVGTYRTGFTTTLILTVKGDKEYPKTITVNKEFQIQ